MSALANESPPTIDMVRDRRARYSPSVELLSPTAVMLFRHMIDRSTGDPRVTPDDVGIAEELFHAALQELVGVGLLRESRRTDRSWELIAPEVAATWLVEQERAQMIERRLRIAAIRSELSALQPLYSQRLGGSLACEEVSGAADARCYLFDQVALSPDASIFACSSSSESASTGVGVLLDGSWLDGRRRLRLVLSEGLRGSDPADLLGEAPQLTDVRYTWTVPFTAVLVGARAGAIITPSVGGPIVRVFNDSALVCIVNGMLTELWRGAILGNEPSPTSRPLVWTAIIRRLAEGEKDDRIARELGLGVRTVRRHIANLMQALGAGGRFEAGILAERAGWLE